MSKIKIILMKHHKQSKAVASASRCCKKTSQKSQEKICDKVLEKLCFSTYFSTYKSTLREYRYFSLAVNSGL